MPRRPLSIIALAALLGGLVSCAQQASAPEPIDPYDYELAAGEYGIERLPASRRRRDLRSWLDQIEDAFTGRILPFDDEAARIWGKLKASGRTLPVEDAQIASIAIRFDLRIATRNTQDFDGTGANLINPWKQAL